MGNVSDGPTNGALELFVPGRLCLFGEHSDWAGAYRKLNPDIRPGTTIVVGTEQGLHARVHRLDRPALVVTSSTDDGQSVGPHEFPLDEELLAAEAQRGGFWSYVAGVAYKFVVEFGVGGLELDNYRTTLPLGKGLSSSAAVCVLVARAFNQLYDLKLTVRGEMQYAYEGERLTPSQCGKMDQACAFGMVAVLMTYDGDLLHVRRIPNRSPLHLVLVDLGAAKDTVAILHGLQSAYPHPRNQREQAAVDLFGAFNEGVSAQAVDAMARGDPEALGALMVRAQSQFDACAGPMCPEQLTSPVLHAVLAHPPIQQHVFGGKGVGSQGDGTAQILCRGPDAQAAVCGILTRDFGMHCMPFTLGPAESQCPNTDVRMMPGNGKQHAEQPLCHQSLRLIRSLT